ncbi:DUF262 domain-containing protein [Cohnella lubricantis]|uniref:DUF262 domain-containing protein n=1 Tax=Cohnella lubricantis TaxID=2163172 RepID=A0A841T667_9BACL|nr:DUF262 domain-containing protein [Cohnella lubricantis]MBB6677033.1 DUF262 domain-containing protein [Cohnella lubricantis]MBP2119297.1 hypothetical protein [Cohnella lubricantis]
MAEPSRIDLNIRAENVQEVYSWYLEGKLIVNRRYQRKLVWTKDEKSQLIDTMIKRYPLPLILLAEVEIDGVAKYEIIDGMQRLNAMFSFIENKLDVRGQHFDLETMASAKQLLDEGKLTQKEPKFERSLCTHFANYKLPISTYRLDKVEDIDEIFRRINSNGRRLSNQEIRQAGVIGAFADAVRDLSSEIRGDVSHSSVLLLNNMDTISITNRDLDYGIKVEDIYWVQNGIFRKEDIRDSRDEDLIADILGFIIYPDDNKPASSNPVLDSYYGRPTDSSDEALASAKGTKLEVDRLVNAQGKEVIEKAFLQTHDLISQVIKNAGAGFRELTRQTNGNNRIPRHYQVIFLAFYEILFLEKKQLADLNGLIKALEGIDQHINITTGGNWSALNRRTNINAIKGIIREYFRDNPLDPVVITGITEFENLIKKSGTEAASYDFKQGLHRLDQHKAFDSEAFEKILQTICGIANLGRNKVGYIVIGVCDKDADARRVKELYNIDPIKVGRFNVVGIDHEAQFHTNIDKYHQFISDRINKSSLSDHIKVRVASNITSLVYKERAVFIIRIETGDEPCFLGDVMYKRVGAQTVEVTGKDVVQIVKLF